MQKQIKEHKPISEFVMLKRLDTTNSLERFLIDFFFLYLIKKIDSSME